MKTIIIVLMSIMLFGCNQPNQNELKSSLSQIQYAKDKYGNCFAVIHSRTYGGAYVASIATIPCNTIEKELLPEIQKL